MRYPCKLKYLDEAVGGTWRIFGRHLTINAVDIANDKGDVLAKVPVDKAPRLVRAHEALMQVVYEELGIPQTKTPEMSVRFDDVYLGGTFFLTPEGSGYRGLWIKTTMTSATLHLMSEEVCPKQSFPPDYRVYLL